MKHCGSKGKKRVAGGKKKSGDPCWPGYEAMGMKQKGGRTVPNCVPKGKKKVGKK